MGSEMCIRDRPKSDASEISVEWGWDKKVSTRGNLVREEIYDNYGRVTETINFDKSASPTTAPIVVKRSFDALGRLEFQTLPHDGVSNVMRTTYTYDVLGRIRTETDRINGVDGVSTGYEYNGLNTVITDRRGYETKFFHRAFGSPDNAELVRIEQPNSVITKIDRTKRGDIISVSQSGSERNIAISREYTLSLIHI